MGTGDSMLRKEWKGRVEVWWAIGLFLQMQKSFITSNLFAKMGHVHKIAHVGG